MDLSTPDALGIDVVHGIDVTTAVLTGELDVATTPQLRSVVSGLAAAGHAVVRLDLGELRFCDSTGLSAMVDSHRELEAKGGRLELARPSRTLQKVLTITGLDRSLHLAEPVSSPD